MLSVLVIGAGVVGSTIAWELAVAGMRVRLIDARTPGDGATRASAGVLAPYIEGHPASPLRDLGRESLDKYDEFIARLRRDGRREVVYERSGTIEVALTTEQAERLAADRPDRNRIGAVDTDAGRPAAGGHHRQVCFPDTRRGAD